MSEELQGTMQGEPVQDQPDVQPTDGQGEGGQEQQQQVIDYEKAYKNLEPEFTRKSQELSRLKGWAEFEKRTGISAEMALQQLESMGYGQMPMNPQPTPNVGQPQPNPYAGQMPYAPQPTYSTTPSYTDPRLSQMEQELANLRRERQMERLSQKFPQFKELYPQVIELADTYGYDLETAFGKVLVDKWDDVAGQIQQSTVNNIRQKGVKQLENTHTGGGNPADDAVNNLTAEELEAAKALGIDPKEYAAAKNAHTLDF